MYGHAGAAEAVSEDPRPGVAAIAPQVAAERYGLDVLADNIEDHEGNQTRFVVVASAGVPAPTGHDRTALVVYQRADQPAELLELFGFESCPSCRRVRQTLTELGLDYVHRSAPLGDARNRSRVEALGGQIRFPYLRDPNTGVAMYESREIVAYLRRTYGAD